MRKTAKSSPPAALHPQGTNATPPRTGGDDVTCLTYTLSVPELTIVAVDASDGASAPTTWLNEPITAAWPDAAPALTALIERALRSRHPTAATLAQPDAAIASAHATCLPMLDSAGTPTQLLLTMTLDQAPAAFTVPEAAKLMQIIDHLPVGVLWTDMQGRVQYLNDKQRSTTNYTVGASMMSPRENLAQHHWLKPDTHEPYSWNELPIPQTIATGQSTELVIINDFFAAAEQVVLVKTEPIYDQDGQMSDIIAVQIDLTAQYHAEQEAMRRAAEQDTIIDGLIDGLIIYDRHGKPTRYNAAALQILGWDQVHIDPLQITEAERMAFYDAHIITGEPLDNAAWPSYHALAGDQPAPLELSLRQPDGSRKITSMHAVPLRDPVTHEITGAATVVRDITALRQLDYMKDEFMSVASHELRTPLTSLLLASRLMQRWVTRNDRAEDLRRLADDMAGQVKRMDRLINNMLDLTRINAQHFALVTEPTDITQMVRAAIDEQQTISGRAITYAGLHTAVLINMDSKRMQQVLANVLSNAIKYDPSRLPIEVTTSLVTDHTRYSGTHILIAIHDHGYGITTERLPHLFEQGAHPPDAAITPQHLDGLGLSLYICRAIVERHGGQIWAESTIGNGSTFYIELPASSAADYYEEPRLYLPQETLP